MDMEQKQKVRILILHNIRSAYNVGSIFRTADAAGVTKIYLTGFTPAPIDEYGRARNDIHKAALGAEDSVSWESVFRIGALLAKLKKEGIFIVGVEQSPASVDYRKLKLSSSTAFVFGNEVKGLSKPVLKQCDALSEIPMMGTKESLNVAITAGIILFDTKK